MPTVPGLPRYPATLLSVVNVVSVVHNITFLFFYDPSVLEDPDEIRRPRCTEREYTGQEFHGARNTRGKQGFKSKSLLYFLTKG